MTTPRIPTVLYVCHNHPSIRPGGVETYALELAAAMRATGLCAPLVLARARRPDAPATITPLADRDGEFFFHADHAGYDAFYGTLHDKRVLTRDFDAFLRAHRPDVVHFQHTLFLGYDLIRQARNTLPGVPIFYTLHEYQSICHHNGQMVRTRDLSPCERASPGRCHECFPDIAPEAFARRKRFIESQFTLVDCFVSPSRFLRDRYIEWGIPAAKIITEEYGRSTPPSSMAVSAPDGAQHTRLGFFGQFTAFKGVDLLLRAMARINGPATLILHGANLEFQPKSFQQDFHALVQSAGSRVSLAGAYAQGAVSRLMAGVDWVVVPSIWWENSPLVIQEAFMHGRPVICADIGGMAEKVTADVDGLHFRAGDVGSLADTIMRAATTPGLWERLHRGIRPVYPIETHARVLVDAYRSALAGVRR